MKDCLFCKIIGGEIKSNIVFESENVIAFEDINPQARLHFLFIHRSHSNNVNEMSSNEVGDVFAAVSEFTKANELSKNGFRVVTNTGVHGCQSVFHTHFHILGGEQLSGFGS